MSFDYVGLAYAVTVTAGGIMGYVKANSVPSFAAGVVFGGLLGYGAYQMGNNPNNYFLSFGVSSFLTSLMGVRFYNTGKFMPAGMVAVISLANVLRLSGKIYMTHKEAKM